MTLAQKLKFLRRKSHLFQYELANASGMCSALISKFENGTLIPTDKQLAAIANGLHIPVSEITRGVI